MASTSLQVVAATLLQMQTLRTALRHQPLHRTAEACLVAPTTTASPRPSAATTMQVQPHSRTASTHHRPRTCSLARVIRTTIHPSADSAKTTKTASHNRMASLHRQPPRLLSQASAASPLTTTMRTHSMASKSQERLNKRSLLPAHHSAGRTHNSRTVTNPPPLHCSRALALSRQARSNRFSPQHQKHPSQAQASSAWTRPR